MSGCRCCGGEERHRETCLIPEAAALRAENAELRKALTSIAECECRLTTLGYKVTCVEAEKQYPGDIVVCATCKARAVVGKVPGTPAAGDPSAPHLSHCNLGEYEGSCKYGEDDCPAFSARKPDVPKVTPVPGLAALPVVMNPALPRGKVYVHPDTLRPDRCSKCGCYSVEHSPGGACPEVGGAVDKVSLLLGGYKAAVKDAGECSCTGPSLCAHEIAVNSAAEAVADALVEKEEGRPRGAGGGAWLTR